MDENAKRGRANTVGVPRDLDKKYFDLLRYLAYFKSDRQRRTTMVCGGYPRRCKVCNEVHPEVFEFHFYYN